MDYFPSDEEYYRYLKDFSEKYKPFADNPPEEKETFRQIVHNLKSHAGFIGDRKLKKLASSIRETEIGHPSGPDGNK